MSYDWKQRDPEGYARWESGYGFLERADMSEALTIKWMAGLTTIRHEQRVEDDAIVFGSYIDGQWHESGRMTFGGDKETKALAISALHSLKRE